MPIVNKGERMKKTVTVDPKVNPLKQAYMELEGKVYPLEEVMKRNLTDLFKYAIIAGIQNKALINMAIRGEVTTGKSTVGLLS